MIGRRPAVTDLSSARVRVPCSTSNLGAGFDTLGLALDRFLDVSFTPDSSGSLRVVREGTLRTLPEDETDIVAEILKSRVAGVSVSGVLKMHSDIPVGRGLGASAAARVAGHDLALAVRGLPRNDGATFDSAYREEGHGDNAAPSMFGGLRAVAETEDGPMVMSLPLSSQVGFAYAAPSVGVSTDEARRQLPKSVSHGLATASLGRLVALLQGLAEGDADLIRIGAQDELHVPYRMALIPRASSVISAGIDAGAWAVTVSGAGSGLIAMCDQSDAEGVAEAMHQAFDEGSGDPECFGFSLSPTERGLERIAF
ncbi:MAG: homoserine kinase [Gemmatimonadetes bacterium]|nr:homoserine kinase [Gemmatimonadota bacterium]